MLINNDPFRHAARRPNPNDWGFGHQLVSLLSNLFDALFFNDVQVILATGRYARIIMMNVEFIVQILHSHL